MITKRDYKLVKINKTKLLAITNILHSPNIDQILNGL